jgi:hypothetical protein
MLPIWVRLAIGVFAGGLFLAYYQERITAGDSVATAISKTVIASPAALYKFVVALLTKATTTTTTTGTGTSAKVK